MEGKTYPIEKRRILAELAEHNRNNFLSFFDEITEVESRKTLCQILPPLKKGGFQKLELRLKQQTRLFSQKLIWEKEIANSSSRIWEIFEKVWALWVQSKPELNKVLLEFDNTADFDESHRCIAPPNSELDRQCFQVLLEANCNNMIDQETIRLFYEYGYFNKDKQIEDLIDKALPHEEIKRRQRLSELPNQVDKLCQEIDVLRSQISAAESCNELEQILDQRIAEVQQSSEHQLHTLDQRITKIQQLSKNQESESNLTQMVSRLRQLINSFESRIVELEKPSAEIQLTTGKFTIDIEETIAQLDQQIQDTSQSVEERLKALNSEIFEIKSAVKEQNQLTDRSKIAYETLKIGERYLAAPQIAHQALNIGERYAVKLEERNEHYQDEDDYLSLFRFTLRRFGITDSDETAAAIHVALKAFPVLEIADTRIINVWDLMCNNHLHLTRIIVEMGWIGLQDWFPDFFADECFGERLKRINLDLSVRKMLEMGDMIWAIRFSNCDRSFPEGYLPSFIKWINNFSNDTIKVFLTRCLGTNRCEINEDVYVWTARLPKSEKLEPIEAQNLRPSGSIVTQSVWKSWCCPNTDVNLQSENQFRFLDQLRSTLEKKDTHVPILLLREIQHYVQLSHDILAPTLALDWGLTLRFLPWIENQPRVIDSALSILDQEDDKLQHFYKGLQQAREKINESN